MLAASKDERVVPLFHAYNRGIVVASIYATTLAILFEKFAMPHARRTPIIELIVLGLIGVIGGAIGGFSNTVAGEDQRRDLKRNALDGLVITLWVGNLILAFNFGLKLVASPRIFALVGLFAAGAMFGAVVGEPILAWLARVRIKGRQPLLWLNAATAGIKNPDVQFVVRVGVQTVMVGLLVTLAFITAIAIIAIIAIAVVFLVLAKVLDDGTGTASPRSFAPRQYPETELPEPEPEPERPQADPSPVDLLAGIRDGSFHGRIDKDGLILDAHGNLLASIDKDGLIHQRDGGFGMKGEYLGRVDKDGLVKDHHGSLVGSIDRDGLVKDTERDVVVGKINRDK